MNFIRNAAVLVTGGAGFIGSNLTDALLALDNKVTVLDNFSTGKRENLAHLAENPAFTLIEGDIRDLDTCRRAVAGMDFILHEAALGSVPRSIKDPASSTAVNILGFVNMLYASHEAGIKRFIFASSSAVYGDSESLPKQEDRIGRQLSPYAITKFVDELFAENFHQLYGLDTIGLRYFNVFGRRQDPSGAYAAVIPKFASALIRHEPPVINGTGTNSRDFTYIDNVIQANLLALSTNTPEALNQVYNVAYGEHTTLNELFDALRTHLGKLDPAIAAVKPVYGPDRQGDIPHSLADIGKAGKLLGYDPQFSAGEGLRLAAKWYFDNLK